MKFFIAFVLVVVPFLSANAAERQTVIRNALEQHFTGIGTSGTMVVLDVAKNRLTIVNGDRYAKGFLPASTFKIANALIALETGVVKDADNPVFKWDGVKRQFEQWNKDHTLRSGFKASAVWQFQEIARQIGEQRMKVFVSQFGYGNLDIGGSAPDAFWLEGNLRISALQQIEFLERLHAGKLPVSARNAAIVKDIMFMEKIGDATLRGKTGWIPDGPDKIGWFVGWVEKGSDTYILALNLDPIEQRHVAARIPIAKAILSELGALPPAKP